MPSPLSDRRWGLVVPVKLLDVAKSRLGAYGDAGRAELALAFAGDLLDAALRCPRVERVLVVTDDARVADALAGPRVDAVPDEPAGGLNAALAHGAALLQRDDERLWVAALTSDLPALRPDDLAAALGAVHARSVVADADGIGSTLLAVPPGEALRPAFGPRSREQHVAQGAAELPAAASLRRDVDTPDDLRAAVLLGVGPRTAAVVQRLGLSSGRELAATVATAEPSGGAVVLDDGRRLAYDGQAVQPPVRLLHPGQRVRLRVDGDPPRVRALTLAGLPLPS